MCKDSFTTNNLEKHYERCLKFGNRCKKTSPSKVCPFCLRHFETSSGRGLHEIQCVENPKLRKLNNQFGRPAWNIGKTKDTNNILKLSSIKVSDALKGRPGRKWSEEEKTNASIRQSKYISDNHNKYLRSKKSWMEQVFQDWLKSIGANFQSEVYRRNEELQTNYFSDFVFEEKRIIVEIDGNHHDRSDIKIRDLQRDHFFSTLGYKTIRINYRDFKKYAWKDFLFGLLV